MKSIPIKNYMTPSPHTIGADQPVELILSRMNTYGIRHLPVLKGGKLVGLISDRDARVVGAIGGIDPNLVLAQDVMSPETYVVSPDTPLDQVVSEMAKHKYGSAIVLENDKTVGIFTAVDAMKLLAEHLKDSCC